MIDMKGDMERRIQQIIEETPMKMLNQLRHIEEKETTMWADNLEKHNKNNDAIVVQHNRVTNQMGNIGNRLIAMQKQIEDVSFKNVELERNIMNITRHNRDLLDNNINALEVKQQAGRDRDDLLTEVKLLRDRLNHQEEQKTRVYKDLSSQIETLNSVVLKNEKDLYDRLREQKKELLEEAIGSKGNWKKLEEMRMEKILGDNEYMKSLMDGLERKVKNEMSKRLSSEFDQKNWLEMQFHGFKDEIVDNNNLEKRSKRHAGKPEQSGERSPGEYLISQQHHQEYSRRNDGDHQFQSAADDREHAQFDQSARDCEGQHDEQSGIVRWSDGGPEQANGAHQRGLQRKHNQGHAGHGK